MSGHTVTRLIAFLVTRVLKTMSRSHLSVLLHFVYPFVYLVNQDDLYFEEPASPFLHHRSPDSQLSYPGKASNSSEASQLLLCGTSLSGLCIKLCI
jgi:hypothetical protein